MQCECIDKDAHNWIEGCLEEGLWKDPVTEERKGLRCEMTYKPHLFGFHVKRIRVNVNLLIHLWFRVPKIFWTRNSVVTYSMKIRSGTWTIWKQWSVDTFLIVSHLRFLVVDYPVFIKLWSWPNVVRHIWIFIFPAIYIHHATKGNPREIPGLSYPPRDQLEKVKGGFLTVDFRGLISEILQTGQATY